MRIISYRWTDVRQLPWSVCWAEISSHMAALAWLSWSMKQDAAREAVLVFSE